MSNFAQSIAVVIGIDRYINGIPPLRTAVEDARHIATLLEKDHDYTVKAYLDEQAAFEPLQQLFQVQLPNYVDTDTRVLLYFAGHGIALDGDDGPAGYLIPQDAEPGRSESFLPMQVLHDWLAALPCRHFLGIFDCCFAGAFRWASTRDIAVVPTVIHQERFDRYIEDAAWQVITSAAHDQKALDVLALSNQRDQVGQHSPFAQSLIDALVGKADAFPVATEGKPAGDGIITSTELYHYLRDTVEGGTAANQHHQTPGLWPLQKHDKGEYIFFTPGHQLNLPPAPPLNRESNPYRGLEAFEEADSHLFFGREKEIEALVDKVLYGHPCTIVLGASGTGKSSLVKAGLLPKLRQYSDPEFHILPTFRPGETPLLNMARVCLPLVDDAPHDEADSPALYALAQQLAKDDRALKRIVGDWRTRHPDKRLLMFIDQLEELATLCHDEAESRRFLKLTKFALDAHHEQMHILATLRLDFEAQFQTSTVQRHWMKSRFVISPMTQDELRQAIEGPASEKVLYFKPHKLVDRLINEVVQMPGALPLLSFTLSELYIKYLERQGCDRALTETDYELLGGVVGSLTQRATQEYEALVNEDPSYGPLIQQVMLRMVSFEGGETARRRVYKTELIYKDPEKNEQVKEIIRRYSEARLIIESRDEAGNKYVEPTHDALVRGWDKLLQWRAKSQETLALQRLVTAATRTWRNNSFAKSDLWANNSRLAQLREISHSKHNWLNALEQDFTDRSLRWRRRRRFGIVSGVASTVAVLIGLTVSALDSARAAKERAQVSKSQQLAGLAEFTDQQGGNFLPRSILLATEAAQQFPTDTAGSSAIVDQALRKYALLAPELSPFPHQDAVNEANFSPDNRWIATASQDRTVQVWTTEDYQKQLRIIHADAVRDVQFSPNSKLVATASVDRTVQVWDIDERQRFMTLTHEAAVRAVRFSPDGSQILTASEDGTARVWNIADEQTPVVLSHEGVVITANFSPAGDQVITSSKDGTARIWETSSGQEVQEFTHDGDVNDARFGPDGKAITAGNDGYAKVWDINSGKVIHRFPHEDVVWDVILSPNKQQILTSSDDGQARIWDLKTGRPIRSFLHGDSVYDVRWSNDGRVIASASKDKTARLWDTNTGEELLRMIHNGEAVDVRFSRDSSQLLTTSKEGKARLWDAKAGQEVARFTHNYPISNVRFSFDGALLATSGKGKTVKLWDVANQWLIHDLSHEDEINEIAFSKDDQYLVSASNDGTARLWSVWSGEEIFRMPHGDVVANVSFSRDGTQIITASYDGTARLWNIDSQQEIGKFEHESVVRDARISPDKSLVATAIGDNTARLWDVSSEEQIHQFEHQDLVWDVRFSPDGSTLATASFDGTGALWDVESRTRIAELPHQDRIWDVRFSSNSEYVATGGRDNTARIWHAKTGAQVQTLYHDEPIFEVSFSADSQRVATVSKDKVVQVWDIKSGRQIARIAYPGGLTDTRFSPDGHWLVTAGDAGIARIHFLSTEMLIDEACKRLTQNLTLVEWERYVGPRETRRKTCPNLPLP